MSVYTDAQQIIDSAIKAALPDTAVKRALQNLPACKGRLVVIAVGKAAWQMAATASQCLKNRIDRGVVITKYQHSKGALPGFDIYEAGHPVPDANSVLATQAAIEAVQDLSKEDVVVFLLSGGGSALFEKPLIPLAQLQDITERLLACGADIVEINTLRKRFSGVKGGKFANLCAPAKVFSVVLSDILGDPLDMIASGPAYPDSTTTEDALAILQKHDLVLHQDAVELLYRETPKELPNVESHITGSVRQLCQAAAEMAQKLGYSPIVLSASLCCEAREAGSFLSSIAQYHHTGHQSIAFIVGGETVVHLTGTGKGGRNQELALAAAKGIAGMNDVVIFSMGSDGTDGPTDAAGGIVDGSTAQKLRQKGIVIDDILKKNDAYSALKAVDALIVTGPTGTNVNDLSVLLIKR